MVLVSLGNRFLAWHLFGAYTKDTPEWMGSTQYTTNCRRRCDARPMLLAHERPGGLKVSCGCVNTLHGRWSVLAGRWPILQRRSTIGIQQHDYRNQSEGGICYGSLGDRKGEFFVVFGDCAQGGSDSNFVQFLSKSRNDIPLVLQIKDMLSNYDTSTASDSRVAIRQNTCQTSYRTRA